MQLIVNGVLVTVPRETGFELLDRDRQLLTGGLTEQAELILEEQHHATLHLLLGTGHLALIESTEPGPMGDTDATHLDQHGDDAPVSELFIDFDAYRAPTPRSAGHEAEARPGEGPIL